MIKIDSYEIDSDGMQYIVYISKQSPKDPTKTNRTNAKYFASLSDALRSIRRAEQRAEVRDNDLTISVALQRFDELEQRFEKMIMRGVRG